MDLLACLVRITRIMRYLFVGNGYVLSYAFRSLKVTIDHMHGIEYNVLMFCPDFGSLGKALGAFWVKGAWLF